MDPRTPRGSAGQRAFLGALVVYVKPTLGAQEHSREMLIGDVDLLKHDTMKDPRTQRGSAGQRAFFEALVAMLSPHCVFKNTVGRCRLVMLIY